MVPLWLYDYSCRWLDFYSCRQIYLCTVVVDFFTVVVKIIIFCTVVVVFTVVVVTGVIASANWFPMCGEVLAKRVCYNLFVTFTFIIYH